MYPIRKYKLESSSLIVAASSLDGVIIKRKTSKRLSSKIRGSDLGSFLFFTNIKCFINVTSRVWNSNALGELAGPTPHTQIPS